MRPSSPLLENLIQQNYSGVELPPLWQVIYQEAMRGHHLLFQRSDVELFESLKSTYELTELASLSHIEENVMEILCCHDLDSMVRVIDAMPIGQRHLLFVLYQRALKLWRSYSKEHMN
ncbi:MAG: hypothetical protein FJ146_03725 [Deltaproteobacteria bacterium]|nr:hypothetical protein [Deltaproteobacteria bacterium]